MNTYLLFVFAGAAGTPAAMVREMDVHELADILIAVASPSGPQQLDSTMDSQKPLWQLLDVREVNEYNIAKLPGFTLLPTSAFSEWAPQAIWPTAYDLTTFALTHHVQSHS